MPLPPRTALADMMPGAIRGEAIGKGQVERRRLSFRLGVYQDTVIGACRIPTARVSTSQAREEWYVCAFFGGYVLGV